MVQDSFYSLLQHYWFLLDALLGALLVFLLFVQGGQSFIFSLPADDRERSLLVNTLGRKWEFTFTTLVTFGGAFFASFPLFYSTSFGGAYWAWIIILFVFVIQAVSYEFRSRPNNFLGKKTFDAFLLVNGVLGPFLIGLAVGTFYTGSEFTLSPMNTVEWEGALRGLEALFGFQNILLGLTVLFLARVLGLMYFYNTIDDEVFIAKAKKAFLPNLLIFLVTFLSFTIWLLLKSGFGLDSVTGVVSMVPYKYALNLIEMPVVGIMFLVGVVLVLFSAYKVVFAKGEDNAIWFGGIGTVFTVLALLLIAGYNNTSFYPSVTDLQSSLTIYNSSSSLFTLKAMSIVSLLIPIILGYIWYAWRSMNKKKVTKEELDTMEGHVY